jgi:hypothetical protein
MRSTTVGWLTSMLRALPVTADHRLPNQARPELRDSISHPIDPKNNIPRSSPTTSANKTEDCAALDESSPRSVSRTIQQGYHQAVAPPADAWADMGGYTCPPPLILQWVFFLTQSWIEP